MIPSMQAGSAHRPAGRGDDGSADRSHGEAAFLRRTRIVATLGPATDGVLADLIAYGVDVLRMNLSHGTLDDHRRRLAQVRAEARRQGRHVAVMADTRGPEVRIGDFASGHVTLKDGQRFSLVTQGDGRLGDEEQVSVNHGALGEDVSPGAEVLIDDGRLRLRVLEIGQDRLLCEVETGGELVGHKKVNVPGTPLTIPFMGRDDERDLRVLAAPPDSVDMVAASFASSAGNILEVRRVLESVGSSALIMAKIESRQAIEHLEEVLRASDAVMVARGDLGVELPVERVPLLQKRIIALGRQLGKPIVTATQMLESMVTSDRPTRAEVTDVANAILDGTDAVMLSAETASGHHPVLAVQVMGRLAEETERSPEFQALLRRELPDMEETVTGAVSQAACTLASDLGVRAILTPTVTGFTARMVARHRPYAQVIAVTRSDAVARLLTTVWGVVPIVDPLPQAARTESELFERATTIAQEAGLVRDGETVILTGGLPSGLAGSTNTVRVATLGAVLVTGQGLGTEPASGIVRFLRGPAGVARDPHASDPMPPGSVVVAKTLDGIDPSRLSGAAALVVEAPGRTGTAGVVSLSLGIPAIVGASGATGLLAEGAAVTIDPLRGVVHAAGFGGNR